MGFEKTPPAVVGLTTMTNHAEEPEPAELPRGSSIKLSAYVKKSFNYSISYEHIGTTWGLCVPGPSSLIEVEICFTDKAGD